ncbi:MAG: hypothetical protein LBH30_03110 [Prevotellaceae bacterium]|jgi:hypothetical protein|nr:hypothetical protein [Prevotellaceae bacterium]
MDLKELKKQLPSGAIKEIAKRANTSKSTICIVLGGKSDSPKKPEILKATAQYLKEYKTRERKAKEALIKALEA